MTHFKGIVDYIWIYFTLPLWPFWIFLENIFICVRRLINILWVYNDIRVSKWCQIFFDLLTLNEWKPSCVLTVTHYGLLNLMSSNGIYLIYSWKGLVCQITFFGFHVMYLVTMNCMKMWEKTLLTVYRMYKCIQLCVYIPCFTDYCRFDCLCSMFFLFPMLVLLVNTSTWWWWLCVGGGPCTWFCARLTLCVLFVCVLMAVCS